MVKVALVSVVILIGLAGMSCKETPEMWNKKANLQTKAVSMTHAFLQASTVGRYRSAVLCPAIPF